MEDVKLSFLHFCVAQGIQKYPFLIIVSMEYCSIQEKVVRTDVDPHRKWDGRLLLEQYLQTHPVGVPPSIIHNSFGPILVFT